MLKDWDFAQFFPNCNAEEVSALAVTPEEKSSSNSTSSSGMTPPRMHIKAVDPLFNPRIMYHRNSTKMDPSGMEPVLTDFSRKTSELELRKTASFDFRVPNASLLHPLPRRQKTDLDLRRMELKKELEERRRTTALRSSPRPPLVKSTSEPCAPLTLLQQVSESANSAISSPGILCEMKSSNSKKKI